MSQVGEDIDRAYQCLADIRTHYYEAAHAASIPGFWAPEAVRYTAQELPHDGRLEGVLLAGQRYLSYTGTWRPHVLGVLYHLYPGVVLHCATGVREQPWPYDGLLLRGPHTEHPWGSVNGDKSVMFHLRTFPDAQGYRPAAILSIRDAPLGLSPVFELPPGAAWVSYFSFKDQPEGGDHRAVLLPPNEWAQLHSLLDHWLPE